MSTVLGSEPFCWRMFALFKNFLQSIRPKWRLWLHADVLFHPTPIIHSLFLWARFWTNSHSLCVNWNKLRYRIVSLRLNWTEPTKSTAACMDDACFLFYPLFTETSVFSDMSSGHPNLLRIVTPSIARKRIG